MSLAQLESQPNAEVAGVPLIFDVLDKVRLAADQNGAMDVLDAAGSEVFATTLGIMATIRQGSDQTSTDYRLHDRYNDYLSTREDLERLRLLVKHIQAEPDVKLGLQNFYAGNIIETKNQGVGSRIIGAVAAKYSTIKTNATDAVRQVGEAITKPTARMRRIGGAALAAAVVSVSFAVLTPNSSEKSTPLRIAPMAEISQDKPSAPFEVAFAEVTSTTVAPKASESIIKEITIKAGDTLGDIAKNNNSSVSAIFNNNRDILTDPALIQPNQTLKIPVNKISIDEINRTQQLINTQTKAVVENVTVQNKSAAVEVSSPTVKVADNKVVSSSERTATKSTANFEAVTNVGGFDKELIKEYAKFLTQELNVTNRGAGIFIGNCMQEAGLRHDIPGGLAQLMGDRRVGMPTGSWKEQLRFLIDTEMERDSSGGGNHNLHVVLRNWDASDAQITKAIDKYERYGKDERGNRYNWGTEIADELAS